MRLITINHLTALIYIYIHTHTQNVTNLTFFSCLSLKFNYLYFLRFNYYLLAFLSFLYYFLTQFLILAIKLVSIFLYIFCCRIKIEFWFWGSVKIHLFIFLYSWCALFTWKPQLKNKNFISTLHIAVHIS